MAGMKAGEAYLELRAQGDRLVSDTDRAARRAAASGDRSIKGGFAKSFVGVGALAKTGIGLGVAAGVGVAAKSILTLGTDFETTMNQVSAQVNDGGKSMQSLTAYAKEMGASTIFSANDAAKAMLDLTKVGLKPAEIQGGALAGAMNLAAIEGMELSDAAVVATNTMNQFGLGVKNLPGIVDALAGASSASSASVASLSLGMQQIGPSAASAGLSINDTLGALSLFDQNALKGADAGTSFKTMLTRLGAPTKESSAAMKRLGLDFFDANGKAKSLTDVTGQLHDKLGPLSDEQKKAAINTLFGSDAQRAATILIDKGVKGLTPFIAATQQAGEAQRLAEARTKGLGGALERAKGSIEGVGLALYDGIKGPATVAANGISTAADATAKFIPKIGGMVKAASSGGHAFDGIKGSLSTMGGELTKTGASFLGFFKGLLPTIKSFASSFMGVLGPGIKSIIDVINGQFLPAIRAILPVLLPVAKFLLNVIGGAVIGALKGAIQFIKGAFQLISGIINVFAGIFTGDWKRVWDGVKGIFTGAFNLIVGAIRVWLNVGILGIFRKGFLALKVLVKGGWTALKALFTSGLGGIVNNVMGKFAGLMAKPFTAGFAAARGLVSRGWTAIKGLFTGGTGGIKTILGRLFNIITLPYRLAFRAAMAILKTSWAAIKAVFSGGTGTITNILKRLPGIVKGLFNLAMKAGLAILKGYWKLIKLAFSTGLTVIKAVVTKLPGLVGRAFKAVGSAMKSAATAAWRLVKSLFTSGARAVMSAINRLPGTIGGVFRRIGSTMRSTISSAWSAAKSAVSRGVSAVTGVVKSLPGKIKSALGNLGNLLVSAGRDVMRGLARGITDGIGDAVGAAGNAAGAVKDKVAGFLHINSPSRVFMELGRFVSQGFAIGIQGSAKQAVTAAQRMANMSVDAVAKSNVKWKRVVSAQGKHLMALAKVHTAAVTKLDAANKKLADTSKANTELTNTLRDNIVATGNIANMGVGDIVGGSVTDIVAKLRGAVSTAKRFKTQLATLTKRGLNNTALRQLIEAGPEAGAATADALMRASKGQIKQVNTLQSQLSSAATSTAKTATSALYQSGLAAAKGLVKGLTSQKKNIENAMLGIAKSMQKAIKAALKIKSPSRVMMELGGYVSEGLAVGIDKDRTSVDKASVRLAKAAVPQIAPIDFSSRKAVATSADGAASGGPLIGSLTLQSDGKSAHDQMEDVMFALRRAQRGGVYAGR